MSSPLVAFPGVGFNPLLVMAVGVFVSCRTRSLSGVVLVERQTALLLLTMTVIATGSGGSAVTGSSGTAYVDGLLRVVTQ